MCFIELIAFGAFCDFVAASTVAFMLTVSKCSGLTQDGSEQSIYDVACTALEHIFDIPELHTIIDRRQI